MCNLHLMLAPFPCVNAQEKYYSLASGNWNVASNWSKISHVGTPSATVPTISERPFDDYKHSLIMRRVKFKYRYCQHKFNC